MPKKIFLSVIVVMLFGAFAVKVNAQSADIDKIIDQIKVSYELNKLNDCRIKLRAVEFSQLKTSKEKEQYAEAYRLLALAYRNHRYSRPAFDIYDKYLSLRDTILKEEKSNLISETLRKHSTLHSTVLDDISSAEKERKLLLSDKAILDGIKKSNLRYTVIFTFALLAIFTFILMTYNKKLKTAKGLLLSNRRNIFEKSSDVTRGQMSFGVVNRLKSLNENITGEINNADEFFELAERELKSVKEAEQQLKNLRDNISQISRLSEVSSKTIENSLQNISGK